MSLNSPKFELVKFSLLCFRTRPVQNLHVENKDLIVCHYSPMLQTYVEERMIHRWYRSPLPKEHNSQFRKKQTKLRLVPSKSISSETISRMLELTFNRFGTILITGNIEDYKLNKCLYPFRDNSTCISFKNKNDNFHSFDCQLSCLMEII